MLNIRNAPQGAKGFIIMNNLKIWNYEDTTVRTIEIDGEIWFVGKDTAEILGYSNTRDALAKHVDDEDKATVAIHDGSQNRNVTVINESGVYALIFGSKLPDAKKFKHWVTHEVLPEIRKTGTYGEFSPLLQLLIQQEKETKALQIQMDTIRDTMTLDRDNWRNQSNDIVRKIAVKRYQDASMAFYVWNEIFDLVDARAGSKIMVRLHNIKNRMKERGYKISDVRKVNRFDVIEQDKHLKDALISIVREMGIKYNV